MQLLRSLIAVDESLGKVIETLEKIGELDNTVIIYSSDNGTLWANTHSKTRDLLMKILLGFP